VPSRLASLIAASLLASACKDPRAERAAELNVEVEAAAALATRWDAVRERAKPLVPAGPTEGSAAVLTGDATRTALIAWSEARGGLPPQDLGKPENGWQLQGLDALAREILAASTAPETLAAVAYLGYRLRGEGQSRTLIAEGFQIARELRDVIGDAPPPPPVVQYAPTEAEVRRAIAVHAVQTVTYAGACSTGKDRLDSMRRWYAAIVVDAPPGEVAFLQHFLRINQEHLDQISRINDLDDHLGYGILVGMADEVHAYRKWLGRS